MPQTLRRLAALVRKESTQLLRDRRTVVIILILPLLELFLFSYAVRLTVYHLPTAVADLSQDPQSRAFLDALSNSHYFDLTAFLPDEAAVLSAVDQGSVKVGIVIPPAFSAGVARGEARALVILDGSDSFSVSSGYSAAVAASQMRALALARKEALRLGVKLETTPITATVSVLYNPSLNDLMFVMPGLVAILLQMMSVFTTAQAVVREYELGTIEQLLATPARPLELMIGKLVPNAVLMLANLALTTAVGVFWFGVPFRGSPWLFAWLSVLFVVSGLGLGLLVSSIAHTQKEAQQITALLYMLSMLLTGFIYPRGPMPAVVRLVGDLIPLTFFLRIARGIITKGIGLEFLWTDVAALAIYGTLIMGTAALTTRRRLG